MEKVKNFLYVVTHPIQVHSPLFKKLNKSKNISFKAIYWQNLTRVYFDEGFNKKIDFGLDLTKGFNHHFLFEKKTDIPNKGPIFKLRILFRLIKFVISNDFQIICFHGYAFPHVVVAVLTKIMKKKNVMRSISYNINRSSLFEQSLRYMYNKFSNFFFDEFWSIGKLNDSYYEKHGVKKNKIILIPHTVDDGRLLKENNPLLLNKEETCLKYNLPSEKKFILFTGKFIEKKQPLMLLNAFYNAKINNDWELIFVGDGVLKKKMEDFLNFKNLKNVKIINFLNQNEIINFYNLAELFVMPSDIGETWGLAVYEAINNQCAIIVSDVVGCHPEVLDAEIGLTFNHRKIDELTNLLKLLTSDSKLREKFKQNSKKYSNKITLDKTTDRIVEVLNT